MATHITPVAIVSCKNPEYMKDIQKFSEKWEKQYKGLDPAWPKDGTFDVGVCAVDL